MKAEAWEGRHPAFQGGEWRGVASSAPILSSAAAAERWLAERWSPIDGGSWFEGVEVRRVGSAELERWDVEIRAEPKFVAYRGAPPIPSRPSEP